MSEFITQPLGPKDGPKKTPVREFGDYEIEGELGRGGMGVVYLARQKDLNRRVALKMLTGHYGGDELRRFLEEAETAASLNHSNILHIYEVGEHEGAPFFSMEYVEGGSLADELRKGMLTPRRAAQLMIQVARALHYAHQNGVVHRDMKPANVLLDPDGIPKVADFGIAKRLNADSQLTRTGAVMGTPTYMAPEQAKGDSRHVGPGADVYSLGAILYEMLAGRPPFLPEDSEAAITIRVLTEDAVSPAWHKPDIPRDLETICMKCLEKEPRGRYVSAAEFAEDLRRYLDDESILAKPPSTVGSSIKWVRRHPWKFVGTGIGALLLVAALVGLVRWDLYQRLHWEYATHVDWVNGSLEPVSPISQSQASKAAAYVRVTRRGRLGSVVKVEVLNPRGRLAVLRRIFISEMIPLYIEGIAGSQPYTEKLPESSTVEFLTDQNNLEAVGRERNGQINWRIIYDRTGSSGNTARARFVNLRGFDAASRDGASHLEFERDSKGRDIKIKFFDAAGKPAPNGEGVYGYKLERDTEGLITRLINLGVDGQPAANRAGLTAFTLKHEKSDRFDVVDAKGQPTVWGSVAAVVTDKDDAGNPTRITYLGSDGQPVRDASLEWSGQEMKRNERGELILRTSFKAQPDGSIKEVNHTDISYDEFGHPADLKFTGAKSWRSALRYDENGNVTEEKFLDAEGTPIKGERGYAIARSSYSADQNGVRIEQTYFDAAGNKTYNVGGYHRLITEFDVTGVLKRQTLDEHDPTRFKYYKYVSEPEFDAQGRNRHSVARFEDAQGKLASNAGLAFTVSEDVYDENGRLTTEWKTGGEPLATGGSGMRIDTEWNTNGKMKRRIRQVCDENREPLAMISSGDAARYEEEYDFLGQRQRIYETGFDEKVVGFSKREAKFAGGKLQSVTHTRADGTEVAAVLVFVTDVEVPEKQPKSAEIRPGDQLVAANGRPVPTTFAWVLESFPGGWIEVLREGRRIRIEPLNPGPVGLTLQDRAPRQAK
jgi:serine/threonine protein kinase